MKKIFLIFLSTIVLTNCAASKKVPGPAGPSIKSEMTKIEIDINSGAKKRAIQRLKNLTMQHAHTDVADDAFIMLGQLYSSLNDHENAYSSYISVINSEFSSPRQVEAALGASQSLYKLGRYDEALTLTHKALKAEKTSDKTLLEIHTLRYNIQLQLGDRLEALKSLVFLSKNSAEESVRSRFRIKALEYIESGLKEDELKTVANTAEFDYIRAPALYRVGTTYFEQRDYSRAENSFQSLIRNFPNTDLSRNAAQYVAQIEARRRVEPFTVGAVLPLTGKHAVIAQKTLRGLQMGLGIYGPNPSNFKLAIIDSEANPDVARRAVERLVIEDSVIAIVGDLLSKTAEPVAQKAEELGVPIIGLSQKSNLTQIGENIFRNALTSAAIVRELVKTAMNTYGHKKFGIVFPNDPYGVEYANIFWDEVLQNGGEVVAAQSYNQNEKDFNGVVSRLVGTYYIEARADEYLQLTKEWYGQQKTINARTVPPSDLLPPIINFDALFVPDDVRALAQIASMLLFNDVTGVRLLGTNLWNTPSVVERGTSMITDSLFVDAQSTLDKSFQKTEFAREFRKLFGEEPSVFEAQAYDSGLALRKIISGGSRSRPSVRDSLARIGSFSGVIGTIQVTPDREFMRPLALLTVSDGKIVPAKPPVSSEKF